MSEHEPRRRRSDRWTTPEATTAAGEAAAVARALAAAPRSAAALTRLAELSAQLLHAPSAHISLITESQTVLGGVGSSTEAVGAATPLEHSVCAVVVASGVPLVVDDATDDERTRHLPPVRDGAVGSYLGIPLSLRGEPVATLCVYDSAPRHWVDDDLALLERLTGPVVAELRHALVAAAHEDERLLWQLAVDAAEIGAFDWNLVTGELRWDERLLELFGLRQEEFDNSIEAFNAAVHPDDRRRVTEALEEAIATCGPYAAEYRVLLPDGTERWISARGRALAAAPGPGATTAPGAVDGGGRSPGPATRLIGAAYDTTAVQDGEARVARVMEAMPTAFFHLDRDWRFTYVNAEGHALLDGIGRELLGGVIWELFPDALDSEFETHYRRATTSGEPVEFEAYYPPPLDRWYEVRAWPTPDGLSVYFIDITDRREALQQAARATERSARLAGITDSLVGTLDIEDACVQLARDIVGHWADWSVITLVDPAVAVVDDDRPEAGPIWRRGLRDIAGWHRDPAQRAVVDRYCRVRIESLTDVSFLARALRRSQPVVIAEDAAQRIAAVFEPGEARRLCLELDPAAAVVVPLRGRDGTVGALSAFRGPDQPPFSDDDVADLVDAAGRAGLALDNLRLYAEQRDLAEGLQRSLLTAPPRPPGLEIAVRYEPAAQAAQVGGDWYDAFQQPGGATNVVIGDVVGHDTAAAAAMGQIRSMLRGIAVSSDEGPDGVLRQVDAAMATLQLDTTVSAIVARLEPAADQGPGAGPARLRWSNAGHPPPLLVCEDGSVTVLWADPTELLLGIEPGTDRTETLTTMAPGATLLLYTDGLVERRGQPLDDGIAWLQEVVNELVTSGLGLEALCDELLGRLLPDQPDDDVALVAVRLAAGG